MRWINRLQRHTVVVHLTSGASLRGVLLGVHTDCLVLTHASYLGESSTEPVDGDVVVPRERVAWLQYLKEDA